MDHVQATQKVSPFRTSFGAASNMWETTPIYSPDLAVHERHVGMSERPRIPRRYHSGKFEWGR